MGSIFEEYRRRHKITTIAPIMEGVLFLEKEGKPAGICLTSSFTKSLVICRECGARSSEIVAELAVVSNFPDFYSMVFHVHISTDTDVAAFLEQSLPRSRMVPYVSKGERDQERWLWNFFLASTQPKKTLVANAFSNMYSRQNRCQDPSMVWVDDQFWLANNYPDIYSHYYESIYSSFAINRKYLLV